jgi:hypothetical protein
MYFGINGLESVTVQDVTLTFENSSANSRATTVDFGQIPGVILVK